MDMNLERINFREDGIFGCLKSDVPKFSCMTLEHAFQHDEIFLPALPTGVYECERGTHTLHNGIILETFQILNVPNHTGMLLHPGNYNEDSDGCLLLGRYWGWRLGGKIRMITFSQQTFKEFMHLQDGVNNFKLTVR